MESPLTPPRLRNFDGCSHAHALLTNSNDPRVSNTQASSLIQLLPDNLVVGFSARELRLSAHGAELVSQKAIIMLKPSTNGESTPRPTQASRVARELFAPSVAYPIPFRQTPKTSDAPTSLLRSSLMTAVTCLS